MELLSQIIAFGILKHSIAIKNKGQIANHRPCKIRHHVIHQLALIHQLPVLGGYQQATMLIIFLIIYKQV